MNKLYLIPTVLLSLIIGANAFTYKEAENWGKRYPECNGKNQSPVLIKEDLHNYFPLINQTLKLSHFQKLPKKLTLKNTGHTVEIKADWSGKRPNCTGGPLHGTYVFEKATFHWAQKRWTDMDYPIIEGIDNKADEYDVEMHLFFYRTDLKSFEKAQTQKGGLAVFKTSLTSYAPPADPSFDNLEKNLHKVQSPNSTGEIPPFRLASYFVDERPPYLFYEGSLEVPPCSESVTWFKDITGYPVTSGLIKEFKKIKLSGGDVSNVRPFQPLNKRQIKQVYYQQMH